MLHFSYRPNLLVVSQQVFASPPAKLKELSVALNTTLEAQNLEAARNRAFHVRRLNEMNLTQRQRGARRRNLWQRIKTDDGQFRWVCSEICGDILHIL
jgi:hypothetical protein